MTVTQLDKILADFKRKKSALDSDLAKLNNDLAKEKGKSKSDDAKIKSLNTRIADIKKQIGKINSDVKLNQLYRDALSKTEDIDLSLKNLYKAYNTAIARGENTSTIEKNIETTLASRKKALGTVSSYAPSYVPKLPIPENWKTVGTTKTTTTKKTGTTKGVGGTTIGTGETTKKIGGGTTETTKKIGGTTETTKKGETTSGITTETTKAPKTFEQIISATEYWYNLPDYIFNQDPVLQEILVQAVNEDWDADKFLSVVRNKSTWWNKNAGPIRERIISLAKYNDLRSRGIDTSNTEYGIFLRSNVSNIKNRAVELFGRPLDDATAQKVAEQIWNGFLDDDQNAIDRLILPYLGKITTIAGGQPVQTYGGEALRNYQSLQAIAKENGLTLRDILPNISTATTGGDLETAVLQKIAAGEIDVNAVAQAARSLAGQGQPKYVKDLLAQGYDLSQIFAPYKNIMAAELEINPDQITLNDSILRSAITDKGESNIFDFKRALRKDSRWQYTQSAQSEVAGAVGAILRDFGFQG